MPEVPKTIPIWKIVLAAILDFTTAFVGIGYCVATVTGDTTGFGFDLTGNPALVLFALMIAYYVIGNRFFRGTLWKHILGIANSKT